MNSWVAMDSWIGLDYELLDYELLDYEVLSWTMVLDWTMNS